MTMTMTNLKIVEGKNDEEKNDDDEVWFTIIILAPSPSIVKSYLPKVNVNVQ